MTRVLSLADLAGRTGRGVRVAVVDSGIHAGHPHVGAVAGGVAFDAAGRQSPDVADRLGHGTAVAAAIREKAPEADLLIARVFDRSLTTSGAALVTAIRWAAAERASLINLSLGTPNADHRDALAGAIADAAAHRSIVVTAAPQDGQVWLPGAIPGVVAVEVDWTCPRDQCVVSLDTVSSLKMRASGYPRPIPGVPPERNLRGQSFAVANATGILALLIESGPAISLGALRILVGSERTKGL
jgi:subtilisin family serine protease